MNVDDGSHVLRPALTYSVVTDFDLTAGLQQLAQRMRPFPQFVLTRSTGSSEVQVLPPSFCALVRKDGTPRTLSHVYIVHVGPGLPASGATTMRRVLCSGLILSGAASVALAQVSSEEHAAHHPQQSTLRGVHQRCAWQLNQRADPQMEVSELHEARGVEWASRERAQGEEKVGMGGEVGRCCGSV